MENHNVYVRKIIMCFCLITCLSSIDGSFSIAMLNTQRISQVPCELF